MKVFLDNVSILAVQNCLLERLPLLLTAQQISNLTDERVRMLGKEPRLVAMRRERLSDEVNKLRLCSWALKEFTIPGFPFPLPSAEVSNDLTSDALLAVSPDGQSFLISPDQDGVHNTLSQNKENMSPGPRGFGAHGPKYNSLGLFGALKTPKATESVPPGFLFGMSTAGMPTQSRSGERRPLSEVPTTLGFSR